MTNLETGSTIVVADRFPVQVFADGQPVHSVAKFILTRPGENGIGRLLAYSAPDVVLYDTTYDRNDSFIGHNSTDWTLSTPEGAVMVRSAPGCGCGNRLKGWTPQELQPYRMGRLT